MTLSDVARYVRLAGRGLPGHAFKKGDASDSNIRISQILFSASGRFSCAAVLLAAACMKTHQLLTDPALGILYGSRWLQCWLVEFELLLAVCLLSGLFSEWCRRIALATFAGFGFYSLYLGITSAPSCGCFGRVQVNPWLTLLLDAACASQLWLWKPTAMDSQPFQTSRLRSTAILVASATLVAIAVPVVSVVSARRTTTVVEESNSAEPFMVLEPEKWIGKRFPLVDFIDVGDRLAVGTWIVVLYHHDCLACQEAIPAYERRAAELKNSANDLQIALIELPPFSASRRITNPLCAHGRLTDSKQWFVMTPAEVTLKAGQVIATASGDGLPTLRN